MNRQQRRKSERSLIKKYVRTQKAIREQAGFTPLLNTTEGYSMDSLRKLDGRELVNCQVVPSELSRQDFEMTLREFGEAIQAADTELPVPRVEYLVIVKPYPYKSKAEMEKTCKTILTRYSPYNFFALIAATPPEEYDPANKEHVLAFAHYFIERFRSMPGSVGILQGGLAGAQRRMEQDNAHQRN